MNKNITIDICGDICLTYCGDINSIADSISTINSLVNESDYSIANFEMAVIDENSFPILKDGPNLGCNENALSKVLELNINAFTLANNHVGDFGPDAVDRTIRRLTDGGKKVCGAGDDTEKYSPIRVCKNGISVALFSLCENEFGVSEAIGVAGFRERVLLDIYNEKTQSDCIIVIFHGGTEHCPFPSPAQRERYRSLVDAGADVIVGTHQHCIQGCEMYKGKQIFYGIGNLLFPCEIPSCYPAWNYGFILRLVIMNSKVNTEKIPYHVEYDGSVFTVLSKKLFDAYFSELSECIDNDELQKLHESWIELTWEKRLKLLLNGIQFLDLGKTTAYVKNAFSCESHRELYMTMFDMIIHGSNMKTTDEVYLIKKMMNVDDWFLKKRRNHCPNEQICCDVKTVIWGCTKRAYQIYRSLSDYEKTQTIIVDRNSLLQGLRYNCGNKIYPPDYAMHKYPNATFIICVGQNDSIKIEEELVQNGIDGSRIIYG